ncbi:MAG: acyl-phosphate glycerol 3-phosphate acyltransferase [Deltaproteobacteria bacterium]|nr:MAG: acyl-phosphate glycerol 3-phosphate acyltransferase [Deltaproteobacteria bacterium]
MEIYLWLLGAYLMGSVPFGVIISKALGGKDPRLGGSGNIGATNVLRTQGKKAGALTLLADFLKGALPTWCAAIFITPEWGAAAVGLSAFLGHCFPAYLMFRGGKGIATGAGVFLAISPPVLLCSIVVFAAVLKVWRYVGLASVCASLSLPLSSYLLGENRYTVALASSFALIATIRHLGNLRRISRGEEDRFDDKE